MGRIAGSGEAVTTLVRVRQVADEADDLPEIVDDPGTDPPEMSFQFGERRLDGIKIGAAGWEKEEPGARSLNIASAFSRL